ncbi:MAG: Ig-like domain-containing protein [Clostridiales bacterium]|nr:Ig-like domain-containing protein [Clostridiales bacterium]
MEKRKISVPLLLAALLAVAVLAGYLYWRSDWKAPTLVLVEDFQVDYGAPVYLYQLVAQASDRSDFTLSLSGNGQIDEEEKTITFSKIGSYPVEITAADVHGNTATATVTVTVVDQVPPVLEAEDLTVYVGDEEPDYLSGVTATDEMDGDLTSAVQVNSTKVDLETPGRYEVTYSVEDRSGNAATATATITVAQQPARELALSRTELSLGGNEYEQLETAVSPADWEGTIVWSSSDPSVATVSDGLVVWAGEGTCTITATADDVSAQCQVTCTAPAATAVWLSQHTLKLAENGSASLTVSTFPSNWYGEITWTTSNTAVATIDANGNVTWAGAGTCTITVTAGGVSDSCAVTCKGSSSTADTITTTIDDLLSDLLGEN